VSTNQISFTAGAARRWPVFRRDRVGEPRAKGFSWDQIARKLTASPSVAQRAFLSEEHTLPKTTPACTAIRTETKAVPTTPDRVGPSEIICFRQASSSQLQGGHEPVIYRLRHFSG
jgi:hypothetical protein